MSNFIPSFSRLAMLLIAAITLAACGGSGGGSATVGSDTDSRGEGAVGILLTDKPADPEEFLAVNVTIEEVLLLGGEEGSNEQIYAGPGEQINLLDLKNESMPFAFQSGIPSGEYCKIRLILSELELVLVDETPEDLTDNQRFYPKLPGNNKLDLNARDCFEVVSGETLVVQLDMDAGRSIHINEANGRYQFRPVVFVDVVAEDFDPKLLRLSGDYTQFDEESASLLLCEAVPTSNPDSNGCAKITFMDETAFFDNVSAFGAPAALSELFEEAFLGESMTVVGWPSYGVYQPIDVDIPDGHLPELGECRLWDPELEPGLQTLPVDCDDIALLDSEDLLLVDHNGIVPDPNQPILYVEALAIELGDFLTVEGRASSVTGNEGFGLSVFEGAPIIAEDLQVAYQADTDQYKGTRFVSKHGQLLSSSDVLEGISLQVDGVLEVLSESSAILQAALVIVDLDSISSESLIGDVTTVIDEQVLVTLDAPGICGIDTATFEFDANAEFDLLTITVMDDSSEITEGGIFATGQSLGIQGTCAEGVLTLESIVILDDQRS